MRRNPRLTRTAARSIAAIADDVNKLYATSEELIARAISKQEHKPACRRACASDHCCRLCCTISAVEGVAIASWLKARPEYATFLLRRRERILATASKEARAETFAELETKLCVFYDRMLRTCRIYPVRPWTCRIFYSIDANACRRETELTCEPIGNYLLHESMKLSKRWHLPDWQAPIALSVLSGWVLMSEGPAAANRLFETTVGDPIAHMARIATLQLKAGRFRGRISDEDLAMLTKITGDDLDTLREKLRPRSN
jgi:Fe-S-cluster containining protein